MPRTRTTGTWINRTSKPGRTPRWKKSDLQVELERVAAHHTGSTLKKIQNLWLDQYPKT